MWSQKASSSYAAAVFGMSDIYLSIVSRAKLTKSSGSDIIICLSDLDVEMNGKITSTIMGDLASVKS